MSELGDLSDPAELGRISRKVRYRLIEMSNRAGTAHLAGALSCVDLLVALYWTRLRGNPAAPLDPMRDRFILSKGHTISALYAVLAMRGYFPEENLLRYNEEGAGLPEQPSPGCAPGVEWATGSLGHGLGVGLGIALGARIQGQTWRTYVLMSDGECQEGSSWEAAMLAPRLGLGSLTVMVDFNKWQATGRSNEIMQMEPLAEKWRSFGWNACEVDGHDPAAIAEALKSGGGGEKPLAIVAHTVKGRGVSFIEDDNNWHYRSPSDEEVVKAKQELQPDA